MTTSFRSAFLCGAVGLATGTLGASTFDGAPQGFGSATAYVVHTMTGDGLPDMPVTVVQIDIPEAPAPGTPRVFTTGPDGSAFLSPLADGQYEAYVDWNNNRSESVFFTINSVTDVHPVVTIYFNPDIDPAAR